MMLLNWKLGLPTEPVCRGGQLLLLLCLPASCTASPPPGGRTETVGCHRAGCCPYCSFIQSASPHLSTPRPWSTHWFTFVKRKKKWGGVKAKLLSSDWPLFLLHSSSALLLSLKEIMTERERLGQTCVDCILEENSVCVKEHGNVCS